jgi:hypothetical protein
MYDVCFVCNPELQGDDAESGHYVTFARQHNTHVGGAGTAEQVTWIMFDDSRPPELVSAADMWAAAVARGGAYLLGYTCISITQ